MSKRILSLVLTLALVLGSFSMAFAAPADVVGKPVEGAVERLGNLGILTGYEDGSFKPENNITRAEFAAVVARATGLEKAAIKGATSFADVTASHWASGYVRVSEGAGLIKGVGVVNGKNSFAPESNISYEQAVTMVVRALGYEPAALENGGYPTGHLIVASREGLLQDVNGVAGELASRALVAQLVDNALDVPKMIAVAYDGKTKYVKTGTDGTKAQYLFNDLQLSSIEGTLSADKDKNKVTVVGKIADKDATKSLIVTAKDFDYAGLDGLKVQAWYNKDDKVVSVKILSDNVVKYDAVKINKTKDKVTTVTEDKEYDFAKSNSNVRVEVKGQETRYSDLASEYSFAKLVLDEYGDVRWIEVYNLDETIVVSEVKGNDVKGYGNKEIADANKYKVLKDGKEVSFTSLKDKDVVLYNSGKKYAAVAPKVVKGKIDTVYSDSFKFEGKNYDNNAVKYISDKDLSDINEDVLKEMKDNGEVEAYFNFNNKPVVVNGVVKEVASNYVMLTTDSISDATRGSKYVTFDYINAEGTKVKNELDIETNGNVDEDIVKDTAIRSEANFKSAAKKGEIFKVSLDAKGKLTKIEKAFDGNKNVTSDFKLSASYVQGFKLQSNTTVFYNDASDSKAAEYKDYKVANLTDAKKKFSEVKKDNGSTVVSKISVDKNGNIVAIVAAKTDVAEEGTWLTGIVTDVRTTTNDRYVTLEVNGVEKEYKGKKDDVSLTSSNENSVYDLKVTEDGAIKAVSASASRTIVLERAATTSEVSYKSGNSTVNLVVEGKYYEKQNNGELKKVNTSDFKAGETATVYYRNSSDKFVQVVVKGVNSVSTVKAGTVTYINVTENLIEVDNKVLELDTRVRLLDANGSTIAIGKNEVVKALRVKDELETITQDKGVATELKLAKTETSVVDRTALNAAIVAGETTSTTGKTAASAKVLTDAIAAAKNLSANATQSQVNAAAQDITNAIAGLKDEVVVPVEKTIEAKLTETVFGSFVTITNDKSAVLTKVVLNDVVVAAGDYTIDGTTVEIFGANDNIKATDKIVVTIGGVDYKLVIK